jgi:hypothetical protein
MKRLRRNVHIITPTTFAPIKCIHFSSGGTYFWWQAGAAKYIQENFDLSNVIVIGSSAGSLTATLLKTGGCFNKALNYALHIVEKYNIRKNPLGLAGVWGGLVREWLHELLPNNVTDHHNEIHIAAAPLNPFKNPETLSKFKDKYALIDACLTSCHIPFFMNGKLSSHYDGGNYVDGSIWEFVGGIFYNEAWPEDFHDIHPDEILFVDWRHDKKFMKSIRLSSQLSLLSEEMVKQMMDAGYAYMKSHFISNYPRMKRKHAKSLPH